MAIVIVPALLRTLTGGQERVTVNGRNVRQIIDDLERRFPGMRAQLIEGDDLKPSIAVSVDGEMGIGGLLDPVRDDSEIYFLPAIGGGR